jgi:hypothetical protein
LTLNKIPKDLIVVFLHTLTGTDADREKIMPVGGGETALTFLERHAHKFCGRYFAAHRKTSSGILLRK